MRPVPRGRRPLSGPVRRRRVRPATLLVVAACLPILIQEWPLFLREDQRETVRRRGMRSEVAVAARPRWSILETLSCLRVASSAVALPLAV